MRNFFLFSLRGPFTFIQFILLQPNSPERKGGKIPPLRDDLQVWGGYLATAQRPVSKGGTWGENSWVGKQSQFENSISSREKQHRKHKHNQPWEKPSGASPQHRSSPYTLHLNSFNPPATKFSPWFCPWPGCPPLALAWPTQAWAQGPPNPSPAPTVLRRAGTFAVRD